MTPQSLRLRLIAGGVVAIALALTVAGVGLTYLFERHVLRGVADDLNVHLQQLLAGIEIDAQGRIKVLRPPVDPRFSDPLSGLYWQAEVDGREPIRSRSLWDGSLDLKNDRISPGDLHLHELNGPSQSRLLIAERGIVLEIAGVQTPVRSAVAIDLSRVDRARSAFASDLAISLPLLGLILGMAMWVQIGLGLRPLEALRRAIAKIKSGETQQIPAEVPLEVQPLVDELNGLLILQGQEITRARGRAADLAHGLKTPLTALAADVRRLRDRKEDAIADGIDAIGSSMRRTVERELTRARVRGGTRAITQNSLAILPVLESVVVTLSRTPDGERVRFDLCVDPDQLIAMDRDDLAEVLGNLLENATRHAASLVRISCTRISGNVGILVEDDGPGIADCVRESMIERGQRLDETGRGAGLGLAIVQDVLDAYGLQLALNKSSLGGLRVSF